ncbi:MAG: hypothetical protein DWQ09_17855 [Proteobacteria bacterium]|nr:MAG: hypothetical protein DWQ09_17855 [Pseudomonadota bacterium]
MHRVFRALACAGLIGTELVFAPISSAASEGDILAPLVAPELSVPSDLHGAQILPQKDLISVFQSLPLEVKYCFRNSRGDQSIYFECNERLSRHDQAMFKKPLFKLITTEWSVNGIRGGNSVVGHIKANGNKAVYTAPKTVPNPATVTISAELDPRGWQGGTAVLNITIVDGKFYVGEISFSGKRVEQGETTQYSGTARLVFDFAEAFEGGVRYDIAPGSAWLTKMRFWVKLEQWTVKDDSRTCQLQLDQLKSNLVSFNPDAPLSGNLFLYSSLDSYIFSTLFSVVAPHKCVDGDTTTIEEMELTLPLTTQTSLAEPGYQRLRGDNATLAGDSVFIKKAEEEEDLAITQSISWRLFREYNAARP